mmetsp:Transcript_186/g.685  ORF Transcript_186/g.685 Transcript_186/m.685 type:complete len:233 (-) Transcript_186:1212-1910(-)
MQAARWPAHFCHPRNATMPQQRATRTRGVPRRRLRERRRGRHRNRKPPDTGADSRGHNRLPGYGTGVASFHLRRRRFAYRRPARGGVDGLVHGGFRGAAWGDFRRGRGHRGGVCPARGEPRRGVPVRRRASGGRDSARRRRRAFRQAHPPRPEHVHDRLRERAGDCHRGRAARDVPRTGRRRAVATNRAHVVDRFVNQNAGARPATQSVAKTNPSAARRDRDCYGACQRVGA